MKKIFTLIAAVIFSVNVFSQAPSVQWQISLGGDSADISNSITQTSDGGYIVAGNSGSINGNVTGNHGGSDYWIVKLNAAGVLQWQKCLGGTNNDIANSIEQTTDGGFIIAGTTYSNDSNVSGNHGSADYWVVKTDSTGTIQWQKCYGGIAPDEAYSVQQTTDSGYIVAGRTYSYDGDVTGQHYQGTSDYWVVKIDGNGIIQWQKALGGTGPDGSYAVQQTIDGGFIVAGYSQSDNGDITGHHGSTSFGDYWVVKLDGSGNVQWQKSLGGTSAETARSIYQALDGGYILAGFSLSNDGDVTGHHGSSYFDLWVVKIDGNGLIQWQKSLGGTYDDWAYSVWQVTDGGYIVTGQSLSDDGDVSGHHGNFNCTDYWTVKLDGNGLIQWQSSLGGTNPDGAYSIEQTADGGYIISGKSSSSDGDATNNYGNYDYWIIKLYPDFPTIAVERNSFSLINFSPNPATTELRIQNAEFGIESVEIFDVLGQKYNSAFNHSLLTIDVSSLAPGIYFVKVRGEKEERVGKFVKQ